MPCPFAKQRAGFDGFTFSFFISCPFDCAQGFGLRPQAKGFACAQVFHPATLKHPSKRKTGARWEPRENRVRRGPRPSGREVEERPFTGRVPQAFAFPVPYETIGCPVLCEAKGGIR